METVYSWPSRSPHHRIARRRRPCLSPIPRSQFSLSQSQHLHHHHRQRCRRTRPILQILSLPIPTQYQTEYEADTPIRRRSHTVHSDPVHRLSPTAKRQRPKPRYRHAPSRFTHLPILSPRYGGEYGQPRDRLVRLH